MGNLTVQVMQLSEYSVRANQLSLALSRVDTLTAKIEQKNRVLHHTGVRIRIDKNTNFCRTSHYCEEKHKHRVYNHGKIRDYRICIFPENCNQQTKERILGLIEAKK